MSRYQSDIMARVVIRNIDSARPSRDELVAEMDAIRAATARTAGKRRSPTAEELIREDRDRRVVALSDYRAAT
jgi:hypothetical protein